MKKIRRLLQPGGEQNPRRGGKTAHEQFEDRGGGVAMIQIDLNHIDLIEAVSSGLVSGSNAMILSNLRTANMTVLMMRSD